MAILHSDVPSVESLKSAGSGASAPPSKTDITVL